MSELQRIYILKELTFYILEEVFVLLLDAKSLTHMQCKTSVIEFDEEIIVPLAERKLLFVGTVIHEMGHHFILWWGKGQVQSPLLGQSGREAGDILETSLFGGPLGA
jgi:hypothetical protein